MRRLVVLLAVAGTGCTSTVLTEPVLHASPYLALYRLRGDTQMQSEDPGTGGVQDNAAQPLRNFGHERHREDVGLRLDLGDGFSGLRADYYKLDMNTARSGELTADWGQLLQGDFASVRAAMDELRLGYAHPLLDVAMDYRDDELRLQLAAGGVFATRSMTMRGREDTMQRFQNLDFKGDIAYAAVRARASWQDFALDLEYAIAPEDFILSGDFEDDSQDFEARFHYQLPQRDILVFAGWRYSEFTSTGTADGYQFENDLVLDGFQLGVLVTF